MFLPFMMDKVSYNNTQYWASYKMFKFNLLTCLFTALSLPIIPSSTHTHKPKLNGTSWTAQRTPGKQVKKWWAGGFPWGPSYTRQCIFCNSQRFQKNKNGKLSIAVSNSTHSSWASSVRQLTCGSAFAVPVKQANWHSFPPQITSLTILLSS